MKVVVRGVRSQSGFGVATIGLLRLLNKAGYDVRYIPLTQDVGQDLIGISEDTVKYLNSITIKISDQFIKDSVFIEVGALGYGKNCIKPSSNISKYILYVTTETTTINEHYVDSFNNKFDEIWTASKFNKVSYYVSGIVKPIQVLPHLIDTDKFNPNLKPYNIKNKRSRNFIVNIDFSFRKGLQYLIPAWQKAFSKDDDVSLILKISDGYFKDPSRPINSLNQLLFKHNFNTETSAPILVIPSMIDEKYLPNLYTTGDLYIAPTLGEGFGLPIAETMACGVPPIVSNHSAPSEYVTKDTGFLIDLDHNQPVQLIKDESLLVRDPNYKSRFIYHISESSLSEQMALANSLSTTELKAIGVRSREQIENLFSFEPLIKTLNYILKG